MIKPDPCLIIVDQPDGERIVLLCKRCGDGFTFLLPASMTMTSRALTAFSREHSLCRREWDQSRRWDDPTSEQPE